MKRKNMIFIGFITVVFIGIFIILFYDNNSNIIIESGKDNTIVKSNALTMMYETGYQTGEYQVTSDNAWPRTDVYTFNETLSKCENGGTVTWNSETNRVVMQTSSSDK